MVRPNQIVEFDPENNEIGFLMFARSEPMVKRRVLFINFPSVIPDVLLGDKTVDDFVKRTKLITEGRVNRYEVVLDTSRI